MRDPCTSSPTLIRARTRNRTLRDLCPPIQHCAGELYVSVRPASFYYFPHGKSCCECPQTMGISRPFAANCTNVNTSVCNLQSQPNPASECTSTVHLNVAEMRECECFSMSFCNLSTAVVAPYFVPAHILVLDQRNAIESNFGRVSVRKVLARFFKATTAHPSISVSMPPPFAMSGEQVFKSCS